MTNNRWKRTFFIIWAGQALSILGSAAAQFAIVWWLAVRTGSPMVLAMAAMAVFLPAALVGPFAGVWVDRLSRRTVMIGADLFIAAMTAVLGVLFLVGTPPIWAIYALLLLAAVGSVFHGPAMQAAIPMLVPESELVRMGGWGQALQSVALMIGPAIGTAAMTSLSMSAVMLIDVLGALVATGTLLAVKIPDPPAPDHAHTSDVLGELRAGLVEIRRNPLLVALSVPVTITALVYVPVSSLFPLMVNGHFGASAWHASLVELLFAGGMLASSLILGVWGGLKDRFLMITLALGLLGLTLVAAGLLPRGGFAVFAALSLVMGMSGNFFSIPYIAHLQATVAPEVMGRVLGLVGSVMSLAIPVGLFVAGPLARMTGVAPWFAMSGAGIVGAALLGHALVRAAQRRQLQEQRAITTVSGGG